MGIDKICLNSHIPNKRTKLNPLTKENKKENRKLSSTRIIVEQIMQKSKCLKSLNTHIEIDENVRFKDESYLCYC